MNIFKNKFLIKLIATLCLFLALISFGAPTTVHADPGDDDDGWGGVLITPVIKLLTALGDGVLELLHSSVQSQHVSMLKIDGSTNWMKVIISVIAIAIAVVAALAFIGASIYVGGAVQSLMVALKLVETAAATTITLGIGIGGIATGVLVGTSVYEDWIPDDIYLPTFSLTAEEIFSNEIALFDINFFSNDTTKYGTKKVVKENDIYNQTYSNSNTSNYEQLISEGNGFTPKQLYDAQSTYRQRKLIEDCFKSINETGENIDWTSTGTSGYEIALSNEFIDNTDNLSNPVTYTSIITVKNDQDKTYIITYVRKDTPVNSTNGTFKSEESVKIINKTISQEPVISTAQQLKGVVSKWYFILRNLALLVLMVVLIYIGIRITLASTSGDKAKYKERLTDWIVAMCLLFVMHYIMVFAVEIVDKINNVVKAQTGPNGNFFAIDLTNEQATNAKELFESEEGKGFVTSGIADFEQNEDGTYNYNKLGWKTDLAGYFRLQSQKTNEGTGKWVGYSFAYFVLVLFTLFFAWTYLKRIIYMTFLTMIAPLVAMTYPIDKITDGKAQAFNSWLREYIFNLLIQPMHLLLYSVLVSSAYELATDSAIYALVALGFMIPAEKLMRKFFGFEKASTPGLLGGAAGAALAMTGINKLLGHRPKGGSSGGKGSGGNESSKDSSSKGYQLKQTNSYKGMAEVNGIEPDTRDEENRFGNSEIMQEAARFSNEARTTSGAGNSAEEPVESKGEINRFGNSEIMQEAARFFSGAPMETNDEENRFGNSEIMQETARRASEKKPTDATGEKTVTKGSMSRPQTRDIGRIQKLWNKFESTPVGASTGAYYRALGQKAGNKIKNAHPIRAMARGAAGLAGAATFGAMGLAAGVVSGDPSKAFQYAGGAALGGSKFASSTANAVMKATTVDQDYLQEYYEMAEFGDEYKNHILERELQKKLEDEKNIIDIQKALNISRGQAKEVLNTTGRECILSGINDSRDIAAIHEITHRPDTDISLKEAIYAKKISNQYSADPTSMMSDKLTKYENTLTKNYKDTGLTDAAAKKLKDRTIQVQSDLFNAKSSFNKIRMQNQ